MFAVLIALFALLTLCPVESVKHDDAEKSKTRIWDTLETPVVVWTSWCSPPEQVIAPLASFGECDLFLMLDPAPYLSFVPLRTDVLCVLMLFLSTTGLHTLRNSAPCPMFEAQFVADLFVISCHGMLVGPVLGGVLFQLGHPAGFGDRLPHRSGCSLTLCPACAPGVHRLMSVSAAHLRCVVFSSCFHLI